MKGKLRHEKEKKKDEADSRLKFKGLKKWLDWRESKKNINFCNLDNIKFGEIVHQPPTLNAPRISRKHQANAENLAEMNLKVLLKVFVFFFKF